MRNLRHELEAVRRDLESGRYPICFGGRELFKAQHNPEANGFRDHAEWLLAWRKARSGNFLVLGSKDETCGNQTCTYTRDNTLRIRVPDRIQERFGHHIRLGNVVFPYGQEHLDRVRRPVCVVRGRKVYPESLPCGHVPFRATRRYVVPFCHGGAGRPGAFDEQAKRRGGHRPERRLLAGG
ncbi:hypothetical protein [Ammonifex degensii]|uniref:hypothetical protein n=1 Tax=Ammonifex degensii TaxID=42838 RepID=UPI001FE13F97|nr:hypothetical protein [Ammonifex degensii]